MGIRNSLHTTHFDFHSRVSKITRTPGWVLVLTGLFFFVASSGEAFMDHGSYLSRDFAILDIDDNDSSDDLVFLTWGGKGTKKERLTLFAFCADGNCSATRPVSEIGDLANDLFGRDPQEHDLEAGISVLWDSNPKEKAFCDLAMCWNSSNYPDDPDVDRNDPRHSVVQGRCDETKSSACYWAVELPGSRGNISHSPPVIDEASERVFIATVDEGGGGSLWAFDFEGNLQGMFRPKTQHLDSKGKARYRKKIQSGFYARPAVHPYSYEYSFVNESHETVTETQSESLVFIPGLKNAYLYILDGRDLRTVLAAVPINNELEGSGGRVRFEPIVEAIDGSQCAFSDAEDRECKVRIWIGIENGAKRRGLHAFDLHLRVDKNSVTTNGVAFEQWYDINPNDSSPPAQLTLHYALLHEALPAILGGAVIEATRNAHSKRFMAMTLDTKAGAALIDLDAIESSLEQWLLALPSNSTEFDVRTILNEEAEPFFAIHPQIRQTHRTRPIAHHPCANENCEPTLYIGQKGGAQGGGGRVFRFVFAPDASEPWPDWTVFDPLDGQKWDAILAGASPESTADEIDGSWPDCQAGNVGLTTTSWSSPFPYWVADPPKSTSNPEGVATTYVFVGSSHASKNDTGGVYRLEILDGTNSCPIEDPEDAWFDYDLSRGWRTTPIVTKNTKTTGSEAPLLVHIGTSKERFFTLDLLTDGHDGNEVTATEWCYQLETGEQYGDTESAESVSLWESVCLVNND